MATKNNPPIALVLLGKTGQGKSSTGNTLLGTYRFEEGNNTMAETKVVVNYTVDYNGYRLKIFDTPGYFDVEKKGTEYVKYALENMNTLMEICNDRNEVIGAFLLVINSQERFSSEDKETIAAFETTFGKDLIQKHCIIVITKGDWFDVPFDVWLERQTGAFKELLKKCEDRVIIVCNKEREIKNKDEVVDNENRVCPRQKSREDIMNAVFALQRKYPNRYSYEDYMLYANDRNRLLLKSELETLVSSYTEKLSVITYMRKKLKNKMERDSLLKEIAVLRFTIQEKDNRTGLLKNLLDTLAREEELVPSMDKSCTVS